MPEIDVVIPTRNRPAALVRCLRALTRQTFTDFGVIVIDDASDPPARDGVPPELLEQLELRFLRNDHQGGPARARNRGLHASDAAYIAFIDDDVCAHSDLLRRHLETMRASGTHGVVIGPLKEPPDWKPAPWNLWEARKLQFEYDRMVRGDYRPTWRQLHTGNALVRREALMEVGGFDEGFTRAEDIELGLRLRNTGHSFVFREDAIGWHYIERSRTAWLETARRYAVADAELDRMYPEVGWAALVRREAEEKHPLLLAARRALRPPGLRRSAIQLSTLAASALFALRLRRISMYAVSLAYDLQNDQSLKEVGI